MRRSHAIAALLGLLALFIFGSVATIPVPPVAPTSGPSANGDGGLFEAVIDRLREGEPYYDAMGTELRRRVYPTASPFNWRTPVLYVAMAWIPEWATLGVLLALSGALVALFLAHLSGLRQPEVTIVGLMATAGVIVTMIAPACRILTETWSGLLIGLSVAAYLRGSSLSGALLGITALFVRELAAPYCVVAALLAVRHRRRVEIAVWTGGLIAFGVYYASHVIQANAHRQPGDLAHLTSWVQFGGVPVWLLMMKVNGALMRGPQPLIAAAGVLLVSALWAPRLSPYISGTVIAYSIFFLIVGQPFNDYWGYLPSLVWALGYAYGIAGLSRLIQTAAGGSPDRVRIGA